MQETRVQSLGQEDPLEEEMTTHSSILAWRIPWTEEPGGLQSRGRKKLDITEWPVRLNLNILMWDPSPTQALTFFSDHKSTFRSIFHSH